MLQGKIAARGVFPPEGCVEPNDFIAMIPEVLTLDSRKEGGESFGGIIVQKVDGQGNVTNISL